MSETRILLLGPSDQAVFDHVAADVFDDAIDAGLTREFLDDPRHHIAVAVLDGQVIGMASAVHYVHPDKSQEMWINEVGVGAAFRSRGVGGALLEALKAHARELGCTEAWVLTEPENLAARRLYASVGGTEANTIYVTIPLT
jgi:GNAT superfamily N-acetyltransferase